MQALPVFTFANQAGLDMLETTLVALQDITLEKIFDDHGKKTLCSEFPQIMQQVHLLPSVLQWEFLYIIKDEQLKVANNTFVFLGICLSSRRHMPFEHGPTCLVWKSCGLEGAEWWRKCTLHLLYVCELVLCLMLRFPHKWS